MPNYYRGQHRKSTNHPSASGGGTKLGSGSSISTASEPPSTGAVLSEALPSEPFHPSPAEKDANPEPAIRQYLTIGINSVTKKLESLSKLRRSTVLAASGLPLGVPTASSEQLVFVCQADIDPPILISHFPSLVAACNSARPVSQSPSRQLTSWLIPLPRGAEVVLAQALGLKRVSVLAIDVSTVCCLVSVSKRCTDRKIVLIPRVLRIQSAPRSNPNLAGIMVDASPGVIS